MRVGFNPNKDKIITQSKFYHKVIVPVYIPNFQGYFQDSFKIFKLTLESLYKTCHSKTYIAISTNGCCEEVIEFVNNEYLSGNIHEIIHHKENIGKLNSILKCLSGTNEILITISDADVLFCDGWQEATEEIFENFSKAGVVSTTPGSKSTGKYDAIFYWDYFFSKRLKFSNVIDPNALIAFAKSVGNENLYNESHLSKYLTLEENKIIAVAGAAHFVATYKGVIFKHLRNKHSEFSLGGNSEEEILDLPPLNQGYYRFSTTINYTYHMGNVFENWMTDKILNLKNKNTNATIEPNYKSVKKNSLKLFLLKNVLAKIIYKKYILSLLLIWKGLSKEEAKNYLR